MTGAAAAIALLVASAAPASAGFRYLPPAGAEPVQAEAGAAESIAKSSGRAGDVRGTPAVAGADVLHEHIEPRPGSGTKVSGLGIWRVHAGEMLRETLGRWGARAGGEVVFLTDRRYRLEGAAGFEGGFADVVQALFEALSHLPHPPVATRSESGTTLLVTHRSQALEYTETSP